MTVTELRTRAAAAAAEQQAAEAQLQDLTTQADALRARVDAAAHDLSGDPIALAGDQVQLDRLDRAIEAAQQRLDTARQAAQQAGDALHLAELQLQHAQQLLGRLTSPRRGDGPIMVLLDRYVAELWRASAEITRLTGEAVELPAWIAGLMPEVNVPEVV